MGNICIKKIPDVEEDKTAIWIQSSPAMPTCVPCQEINTFNCGEMKWMLSNVKIMEKSYSLQQYEFTGLGDNKIIEQLMDHVLKPFYENYVYLVKNRKNNITLQILVEPLQKYQPKKPEDFSQLVKFIDRIHKENLIFRGLLQENIYLSNGRIVVVGLHQLTNITEIPNFLKYQEYVRMPPESITEKQFGQAGDWWCLGALIYFSSQNKLPYQNNDHSIDQHLKDKTKNYKKLIFANEIENDEKDIILELLNPDQESRLKFSQKIKQHSYFKNIPWNQLETQLSKIIMKQQ